MSNISNLMIDGILNYLLIASLIAFVLTVLVWSLLKLTKIGAPIYRHMIWLYVLISIVTLPALWLYGPKLTLKILPGQSEDFIAATPQEHYEYPVELTSNVSPEISSLKPLSTEIVETDRDNPSRSIPVKAILAIAWFVGILFMFTRLIIGWFQLHRIYVSASPIPENDHLLNIHCGRSKSLLTTRLKSPVCFGIFHPVIILPRDIYNQASSEELNMIMNHEKAHIMRKDCLVNLFQRIVEAIFFFHPLIWYVSSRLTQQREHICDNYVIAKGARIMEYTKFLSRIAEQGFEKTRFQAVALFEGRLVQRVKSLLDPKHNALTKASRKLTVLATIVVLITLFSAAIKLEAKTDIVAGSQLGNELILHETGNSMTNSTFFPQNERLISSGNRPTGNCSLSGKVVSARTGEPLGHATVYLFYTETQNSLFIEVASDGTFIFRDIPTGPFSLRTTHTVGFQDVVYNPEGIPGTFPQFSLEEGEQRSGIVLEAQQACYVSGRVLDEDGNIPENVDTLNVLAWFKKDDGQGYMSEQVRVDRKDGSYLIDGLGGQPVYVMAINWRAAQKGDTYPPIYYPGTFSRDEAKLITFDDKWSAENIDIQLQKTGGLILEGIITDQTGKPVPEAFVVAHRPDMLFDFVTAYTDQNGYYQIQGLGDGEFLVHVDAVHRGFVRTREPVVITRDNQKHQLDFTLRQGVNIYGNFVDTDGNDWQIGRSHGQVNTVTKEELTTNIDSDTTMYVSSGFSLTNFRNKYRPLDVKDSSGGEFSLGTGDYEGGNMIFPTQNTFILQGMKPGHTIIFFSPFKEGCKVSQILYNGQNIMDTGIETVPGQEIDITIVIGND